ncbi:MAG TPA: hypothetical protein VFQ43_15370 [Nitrososphaera sp.]|nr:hypothetical protein [Nitrososphaera sp.]
MKIALNEKVKVIAKNPNPTLNFTEANPDPRGGTTDKGRDRSTQEAHRWLGNEGCEGMCDVVAHYLRALDDVC